MNERTKYAIVGAGSRSSMFSRALLTDYAAGHELVAWCDVNQTRMDYWNHHYANDLGVEPRPTYKPDRFETMVAELGVDTVIVTTPDCEHDQYICLAMESGCDVICEKPMTIDETRCQKILDTQAKTGRQLKVTFNYRYAPRNSKVRELIQSGEIGEVFSVDFEWLLNTVHGADYFRRWHRDKANSGGLMVHKATHHFDLVNWWIQARPDTVFGLGGLRFYGKANARARGVTAFYDRALGSETAKHDPFALDLHCSEQMRALYLEAEHEDGYQRDRSVFGDGISIEDDMAVLVGYDTGATLTYHLTAYSPWEGYRVAFNGSRGRLELTVVEQPYVSAGEDDHNFAANVAGASPHTVQEPTQLLLQRHWEQAVSIDIPQASAGGHGGGDAKLLHDLFEGTGDDPLNRAASQVDGAMSILTGIAANRAFETKQPVHVPSLVQIPAATQAASI